MSDPIDMSPWQGRIDSEESGPALRWHQVISPLDESSPAPAIALLGFACDAGVQRNKGRIGAREGPVAIRSALANLSYATDKPLVDAGDVVCVGNELERAQTALADTVAGLLDRDMKTILLGGGHEIAWGSFQGIMQHLRKTAEPDPKVGIINFDAHLDLRNPVGGASSGTPFRQIAEACAEHQHEFLYQVIGVSPSANTVALFDYARSKHVRWIEDVDVQMAHIDAITAKLQEFLHPVDYIYLTICLDVCSASLAPGVSAPAGVGISSDVLINLVRCIRRISEERAIPIILADVAEMNPRYDPDGRTARLAARIVWEICQ